MLADKPGAPASVSVVETHKRSVVLTWTAPANDGGAPISGYRIEHRVEGGFSWEHSNDGDTVSGTRYTVTGLQEGTLYELRVAAINIAGTGDFTTCTMPVEAKEEVGE